MSDNDNLTEEMLLEFFNAVEVWIAAAKQRFKEKKGIQEKKEPTADVEETFLILKFEPQQGAKIGEYEVAYAPNNIPDKFRQAYNILRNSNATIKDRYHGEGYEFSYWLYGADKIYRQKLEPKA